MTAFNTTKPTNFTFVISKPGIDTAQYQLQSVIIPAVTAGTVQGPSVKLSEFNIIGSTIGYADLVCTFLLDENMDAYLDMYKWIKELIEPEGNNPIPLSQSVADATLYVLTNNLTIHTDFRVHFYRIFPYSISEIPFTTTATDDTPLTFNVSFKYRKFDIEQKNKRL